ncbi:hypothetical protein [Fusibacter sp. 3D3]|uniref:hypothetical protein n=1 Tax=Fusibacter sp. 3D3 TaxID=1048380 RepID=UPI0008534119|nr:hypothetical protein [Fusibacter sp. 3D3]GAU80008.1 hypothetical protein F3D3_4674 [Fusibacter sp. 3D3]
MDHALLLKIEFDNGRALTDEKISTLLSSSEVIKSLTSTFSKKSLYPIWRLLALSEIPYVERLKYTQDLVEYIEDTYATSDGFSITGKGEDLLPCYNAMLIEVYSKLGYADRPVVTHAVEWIKKYQIFERNEKTVWTGKGIQKYGGCMKSIPCYIGLAKTVKALIYYSKTVHDDQVIEIISKGTEYLLQHNLYQRLSNSAPITKHILDIAFPQSYQLNIIELLDIAYMTEHMNHPSVKSAVDFIKERKTKYNDWRINYIYKADGFISFDKRGQKGEWITYLLEKYLNQIN